MKEHLDATFGAKTTEQVCASLQKALDSHRSSDLWRPSASSNIKPRSLMLRHFLHLAFFISASATTLAEQPDIRTGQYVRDRDSGTLTIRSDGQNRLTFEIESIGGNCHLCGVSGVISGAIGRSDSWAADEGDSKCEIYFSVDHSALVVRPISEECRAYCGMRAGFDGTYRIPPAACTSVGRQRLRDSFLSLYRSRRYAQATGTLQKLITQCETFMGWIEMDQVRNDLALAQHHNGEIQQCLATLNTTLAAKVKDEEELKAGNGGIYLPPCDFDNYIDIAKSTWFNKALCTKAMLKRR